ncbi:Histidine kinase G2 [Aspergillus mulundensis]|uniref:Histidine kinase G2 n=1 Tax=Aspergillus mulundensis TaxID=1810919 RepID=A0A3D8T2H4_9EURO|nr:Histidine kinase G2 [Aspergillus mulundensis]RDW92730.1 Histidine kinase G2 [Aspergillus mulundensis]
MDSEQYGTICAQQLADTLPVGVAVVNPSDEIVFKNRRFQELTANHLTVGTECLAQSVHPDDYEQLADAYRASLRLGTAVRREYRTKDHTEVWRAVSMTPLKEKDLDQFGLRDNRGLICMISDITPEKTAELLQRKIADDAQERKQQQERFIDMISHEVRNPLSAILHCAEDIMDVIAEDAPEDAREQMARISEAAQTINLCVAHQKKIIDDVLIYSKLDASMLTLSPQVVQPKSHLATLLTMFKPELRKQEIEFHYQLDKSYADQELDWVMADLDKMGQVLINLVSNAIKFTAQAEGQRMIRVSMGAAKQRPPSYPPNVVFFEPNKAALKLDSTQDPEWGNGETAYIMVAVKDTGIGISDQHQKLLFERFKQATPRTDRIYGGYGLGLNISRRLCHMHGGEIGVSSKEGDGSTFGFFFSVRRSTETPPEPQTADNRDVSPVDELCYQIKDLDSKIPDVKRDTSMAEFDEEPPVKTVREVSANTVSDNRKKHSAKLAREVHEGQGPQREKERHASNVDESSPKHEPAAIATMSKLVKGPRVLFVEDNVINQKVVSRKLKISGFEVTTANNGQEALEIWEDDKFDCILMDQEMPVMDGNTATKEIRELEKESGSHIPILGVTANVRQDQQADMLDAGMDGIIHKPYKMQELCEKIHQMVPQAPSGS